MTPPADIPPPVDSVEPYDPPAPAEQINHEAAECLIGEMEPPDTSDSALPPEER
jgi:hypothetical protein